ncbi:hypothetical protein B0A48_16988 [Cryoendolithus antarcticus]|uniref:Major facilitator superfamily (MFS) profile domain-containing protein n=1 Tax=Cryoendolithus antarcticus TaxID=1507870 RepID=A0A1V8SBI3_9PEZI|nr:hypothetical protein B0A48_16988 [Cryoendolithus antarcticus]
MADAGIIELPIYPNKDSKQGSLTRAIEDKTRTLEASTLTAAVDETPPREYPGGTKLWLAFLALIFCLLLGGLDGNIIAVAVPSITDNFHTIADVGWYATAYRLTTCTLQFTFGKLYKLHSTKWTFISSQAVFLIGSVLCAAATSSSMFVVGRAVTGIGVAGGTAGFWNLLMHLVAPAKRPVFGSIFGAVEVLASLIAPPLGGVITQYLTWRWCFWISLPLGCCALIAMVFLLPEVSTYNANERPGLKATLQQLDLIGTTLLSGSLTVFFLALNWAGVTYAWSSARIIALLAVSGVLLVVLGVHQSLQKAEGILPWRVIRDRNVAAAIIFSIGLVSSLTILEYYAPAYFQAVHGYTAARSGYMMLPSLIGTLIGLAVQGPGTSFFGYYTPFMVCSAILTPVATGLMTTWGQYTTLAPLICYFGLLGFAAGVGFQCPQNSIQTALSKEDVPLGLALVLFAQSFGPALFTSVSQIVFTNRLSADLQSTLPGANVTAIEALGLTEIRKQFSDGMLDSVVSAYGRSITASWYVALALACLCIIGALGTEWKSVKKDKK